MRLYFFIFFKLIYKVAFDPNVNIEKNITWIITDFLY